MLQVFGARIKTNGLAPKALVGAAIRKLAHLIYCAVKPGNRLMQISLRERLQFKTVSDPIFRMT